MAENKIKFGLKNVYYSILTYDTSGNPVFATPVAFPGAVSLTMDPQGDRTPFYADDVEYWVGNVNNGYSGSLEIARTIDSFRKSVLGEIVDNKGVLLEDKNAAVVHFALLFQFDGDEKETKHVLYNCTAGRPGTGSQTKGETIEPQTESIDISAASIRVAAISKDVVKASTTEGTDTTTYNGWFSAVYVPAGLPV